jgi:elongation factor Tu
MTTTSPPLVVGILGASKHGKSTLAAALLLRLAARREAEVVPALEIYEDGVHSPPHPVWYRARYAGSTLLVVDCPSTRSEWPVAVLPALDGAVLVVSAARGIERPTCEILLLARQAGIRCVVGYLSTDVSSEPAVDRVERDARRLLHELEYPGDDIPFVWGDSRQTLLWNGRDNTACRPTDDLLWALGQSLRFQGGDPDAPLLLAVGRGTRTFLNSTEELFWDAPPPIADQRCLLYGRLTQGKLRVGEVVELVTREGRAAMRVVSLAAFGEALTEAGPGEAIEVVLAALAGFAGPLLPAVHAGAVVSAPGLVQFHRRFRARLTMLPGKDSTALRPESRPRFFIGTSAWRGEVGLPGQALHPGETALVEVTLEEPCRLATGQSFACHHHSFLAYGDIEEVLD